jgi:hypothetical protein
MALMLRPLRLAAAAYRHLQDWAIVEDGRTVGRIIEDGSAGTPPDRRWGRRSSSTCSRCLAS